MLPSEREALSQAFTGIYITPVLTLVYSEDNAGTATRRHYRVQVARSHQQDGY